jgi:3-hydroxymyristoyl/3-hydroxydecanoyl-(acyl carrier protein) dehydratase
LTLFPNAGIVPIEGDAGRFSLVPDSPCFHGHFDGAPVLPGVAHLAIALAACARQTGRTRVLTGLRNVRFTRLLVPGDEVEVILTGDGSLPHSVRFDIRCGGEHASSGVLVFGAEHAGGPTEDARGKSQR